MQTSESCDDRSESHGHESDFRRVLETASRTCAGFLPSISHGCTYPEIGAATYWLVVLERQFIVSEQSMISFTALNIYNKSLLLVIWLRFGLIVDVLSLRFLSI
jgi:hypothetical protein